MWVSEQRLLEIFRFRGDHVTLQQWKTNIIDLFNKHVSNDEVDKFDDKIEYFDITSHISLVEPEYELINQFYKWKRNRTSLELTASEKRKAVLYALKCYAPIDRPMLNLFLEYLLDVQITPFGRIDSDAGINVAAVQTAIKPLPTSLPSTGSPDPPRTPRGARASERKATPSPVPTHFGFSADSTSSGAGSSFSFGPR